MATIDLDRNLSLDRGVEVDLIKAVDPLATWAIVTCISQYWIISGDHENQAIVASISKKGDVRSTLEFRLTSNVYEVEGSIYALRKVSVAGMRGIMMAIEHSG